MLLKADTGDPTQNHARHDAYFEKTSIVFIDITRIVRK
jgi:hypothetical protein